MVIILVATLNSKRPDKKSQPTISPINHKISQPHRFTILPFILCTYKSCLPVACLIPHSLRSRNSPISSSFPSSNARLAYQCPHKLQQQWLHLTDYVIVQVPRHRWRIIASDDSDIIVPLMFPLVGTPGALLPFFFYLPVLILLLFLSPLVLVAPICYDTRPYEDNLLVLPESCSVWALFFGGDC